MFAAFFMCARACGASFYQRGPMSSAGVIVGTAEWQLSFPLCVRSLAHSTRSRLTLRWAGKQAEVCAGRLRLSRKLGQTVGTILWPCFCKVGSKRGRGALNHQPFSIALLPPALGSA